MDDQCAGRRRYPALLAWLIHPATLVSVVLLAGNDHLLKGAYPGPVTGKLSDVAGLVVLPPLLALGAAVIVPRLPAVAAAGTGVVGTGLAFAAVKATATGAGFASLVWSAVAGPSVVRADRTDLLALPALGLAGWAYLRARRRPATRRTARRFGVLVVLPAATLAVVATSAAPSPTAATVGTWRGQPVVGIRNYLSEPITWLVGDREALVWRRMTDAEQSAVDPAVAGTAARQACVPDQSTRCYRAVPGHLRVEQSGDGGASWSVAWQVPDRQRAALVRRYPDLSGRTADLSSQAVLVWPTTGGYTVVVANGRDGILVREPAGGWRRITVSGWGQPERAEPIGPTLNLLAPEYVLALLAGLLAMSGGGWSAVRRRHRSALGYLTAVGIGALVAICGFGGLAVGDLFVLPGVPAASAGLLTVLVGAIGLLTVAAGWTLPARFVPLFPVLGLVTTAAVLAPFAAWAWGALDYRWALPLAAVTAGAGLATAGWLGRRLSHEPASRLLGWPEMPWPVADPPPPAAAP